jgi:hypothetical protein
VEEIACRMEYIDAAMLENPTGPMKNNGYGRYLL